MTAYEWGVKYGSCEEALKQRKNYDSQSEWYQACDRGNWLFWQFTRLPDTLRIEVLPALTRATNTSIERIIYRGLWALRYKDSDAAHVWCRWAQRWLSGEDRSEITARVMSGAARVMSGAASTAEDWTAWTAAWTAAGGAAIVARGGAGAAVWVAEMGSESEAVLIEELRLQAEDIRREIPEWPGGV